METAGKCIESMNFSDGWHGWKNRLKQSIENSRTYYQDETVNNLLQKLNIFLTKKMRAYSQQYVSSFFVKNMQRFFVEFHNPIPVLGS